MIPEPPLEMEKGEQEGRVRGMAPNEMKCRIRNRDFDPFHLRYCLYRLDICILVNTLHLLVFLVL